MKTYRVFVDGIEMTGVIVRAASHNAAEKKAKKLFPGNNNVSVEYTEI